MESPWNRKLHIVAESIDDYMRDDPPPSKPPRSYGVPFDEALQRWIAGARRFSDLRLDWDALFTIAEYFESLLDEPAWLRIAVLAMAKCAVTDQTPGGIGPTCAHQLASWVYGHDTSDGEYPDALGLADNRVLLAVFEVLYEKPWDPEEDNLEFDEWGYGKFERTIHQLRIDIAAGQPLEAKE